MVFVPAITAVLAVVFVIKEVHIVVQTIEEHARLQTIALSSDDYASAARVIKPIVPISLIVGTPLLL